MILAEQFKKDYTEFKLNILLEDDVKILNALTEAVSQVSKVTDKNGLIQLESDIASYGYQLSAILGRLIGQYNVEKDILEKRKVMLVNTGKVKSMASAERQIVEEFDLDILNLSMFEGVIEEYKDKLYAINHVLGAIEHRINSRIK